MTATQRARVVRMLRDYADLLILIERHYEIPPGHIRGRAFTIPEIHAVAADLEHPPAQSCGEVERLRLTLDADAHRYKSRRRES
jgi:hypothetical protein